MSTVIVHKCGDTVLLATDSRVMKRDFSGVETDAMQKVHEVAPGIFIGQAGYVRVCDFQVQRARELALTDIRTLSAALAEASLPELERLVDALKDIRALHPKIGGALSGELSLHGTILAGRNAAGELGYVYHDYRIRDGRIVCESGEYFGDEGRLHTTSGPPAQAAVAADPSILVGESIEIVRKMLSALKRSCSNIGGPDQIIEIRSNFARWISAPPAAPELPRSHFETADALFAGQATFASSGGGKIIINSGGVTIQNKITSPTAKIDLTSLGMTITGPSGTLTADSGGIRISNGSSSVSVTSSSVSIQNGAFSVSSGSVTVNVDQANYVKISNSLTNTRYGCDGGSVYAVDNGNFNSAATLSINNAGSTSSQGEVQVVHYNGTNVALTPVLSSSASAGGANLPSNPYGFIVFRINGTNFKVPYYAA